MILAIFAQFMSVRASAGFFYKIFGCLQIFLITCHLIQFDKSHLGDRMTAGTMDLPFAGSEDLTYQIGIFDRYIQ